VARSFGGDRPTRIQSHVETRARACEKWGPLWRIITSLDELVELRSRIVMVRLANIEGMKLMYGPELSRLSEPARDQLLIALAVLISFESRCATGTTFRRRPRKAFGGLRSTGCCRWPDNPVHCSLDATAFRVHKLGDEPPHATTLFRHRKRLFQIADHQRG
jgi:hypothetical protein